MLKCISCKTKMTNFMKGKGHHPSGGLSFHTQGHYGSSVFDPMDGSTLVVAICDPCVKTYMDNQEHVEYS